MATAYIVAATPSSPEPKRIANLKSAKAEADARAKLDRVDVEVRTVATSKLTYTAQGAPAAAQGDDTEDSQTEGAGTIDMTGFDAALEAVVNGDAEEDEGEEDAAPAAEDAEDEEGGDTAPATPPADPKAHRGQAECGCSVEKIITTGAHDPKVCADAAKATAQAKAVERERPARPAKARKGGGGRREALGASVMDGWDLLYDKPKQHAQVGRNAQGKYALICTLHKHAHPLTRLVQERGLRGGQRSVWCPECTGK